MAGRGEVWRSLDTLDKDEAKARSAAWDSRVQRLFVTLRKDGDRMNEDERESPCRTLARTVYKTEWEPIEPSISLNLFGKLPAPGSP